MSLTLHTPTSIISLSTKMEDPRKTSVMSETNSVQHVNKKCSDDLLMKFPDSGDEADEKTTQLPVAKRRRKSKRAVAPGEGSDFCDSPTRGGGSSLVERRSLLPAANKRRSALLRSLGTGRSQLRSREIRNKSLLHSIEKTWRKTLEGASRVLLEKHYNRHKRLVSDAAA